MMKRTVILAFLALTFTSIGQVPDYVPTEGLIAFYPFNGDAIDESSNSNTGTVHGPLAATDRFGESNSCMAFDGSNDYISIPYSESIGAQQSFTASAWVYVDGGSCNPRVFELHENLNCGGYSMAFNGSSNGLKTFHTGQFGNCTAGVAITDYQGGIEALEWHHVAITFELGATNVARLYVDGVQVHVTSNSSSVGPINYYGAPLYIGNIAPNRCDWFGGKLDDLGFWNRALTPSEIATLHTLEAQSNTNVDIPQPIPSEGLVAWYPLESNITNAANPGELDGLSFNGNFITDRNGQATSAAGLPASQLLQLPLNPAILSNEFTLSFWVYKRANIGHNAVQIAQHNGPGRANFGFTSPQNNGNPYLSELTCAGTYGDCGYTGSTSEGGTPFNEWFHLAYVVDGINTKIYFNGNDLPLDYYNDCSLNFDCTNSGMSLWFGGDVGGGATEYFNGDFDDIGIWNRALSPGEVASLFSPESPVYGCMEPSACNYDAYATEQDGTCDYCSCTDESTGGESSGYTLTVEEVVDISGLVPGQTTYRFYVDLVNEDDFLCAVYGNATDTLRLSTEAGFYNSPFGAAIASGINPLFFPLFPELNADSWITIGIEQVPNQSVGEQAPSVVEDAGQPFKSAFHAGSASDGQNFELNTFTGGAWYVLNTAANGLPDSDGRVLVMQLTTSAGFSGALPVQIFEHGNGTADIRKTFPFDGTGTFHSIDEGLGDTNGSACGCTDNSATNYDPFAAYDNGNCEYAIPGCTESDACNYDSDANLDDGSCIPSGCMEEEACNYNADAECDGEDCDYTCCPGPGCCDDPSQWDAALQQCNTAAPDTIVVTDTLLIPTPFCGAGTHWDPVTEMCIADVPGTTDENCTVMNLQELAEGYQVLLDHTADQDSIILAQQAAIDALDAVCGCSAPVSYQGHHYEVVEIGGQCWFAENLQSESYRNGDAIPVLANSTWDDTPNGAQAAFDDEETNVIEYGRLYSWHAIDDPRRLCPSGWHVPDDAEWQVLIDGIGAQGGLQLKASSGWTAGPNGTDAHGFDGRPAGYRSANGVFSSLGALATWWSATPNENGGDAHVRSLIDNSDEVYLQQGISRQQGRSIRCLKN